MASINILAKAEGINLVGEKKNLDHLLPFRPPQT